MFLLSTTISYYFEIIHGLRFENSNAIDVLENLKKFEKVHLDFRNEFRSFRGVQYNTILENVRQCINRVEKSHQVYKDLGYVITENTKQYDVFRAIDITNEGGLLHKIKEATKEGIVEMLKPVKKSNESKDVVFSKMEFNNIRKLSKK